MKKITSDELYISFLKAETAANPKAQIKAADCQIDHLKGKKSDYLHSIAQIEIAAAPELKERAMAASRIDNAIESASRGDAKVKSKLASFVAGLQPSDLLLFTTMTNERIESFFHDAAKKLTSNEWSKKTSAEGIAAALLLRNAVERPDSQHRVVVNPRCPRCGHEIKKDEAGPSLSRRDGQTLICSACGTDEAMRDFVNNRVKTGKIDPTQCKLPFRKTLGTWRFAP